MIIGARLDLDHHGESCRLAFYGQLVALVNPGDPKQLQKLREKGGRRQEEGGTVLPVLTGAADCCSGGMRTAWCRARPALPLPASLAHPALPLPPSLPSARSDRA